MKSVRISKLWQIGGFLAALLVLSTVMIRPASAAIAVRGTATTANNGAGGTDPTIAVPTGTQVGDIIIISVDVRRGSGTGISISGGGQSAVSILASDDGTSLTKETFYFVYPATAPSTLATNTTCSGGCGSPKITLGAISYSGVDLVDPVDAAQAQVNASSTTATAPSVTTTVPNARLVATYGAANGTSATQGSSMTERYDVLSSGGGSAGSKSMSAGQDVTQVSAGVSGTKTMSLATAAVNIGHLVALRPVPTVSLASYRFFQNTDSTTASTPYVAKDTAASIAKDTPFRLRLNLGVASGGSNMSAVAARTFKLQYATESGTCGTYADVTSGTAVRFYDNATPADDAAYVADGTNDPSRTGITVVGQKYHEANPLSMATNTPSNEDALWDVALTTSGVNYGDTYCFRVIGSDGSVLNGGYTVTPEFTIATPTITQANYRWFANADSATPASPLATQDTVTTIAAETPFRLRQRLAVDTAGIALSEQSFKLQYAEKTGACSGLTYTNVWPVVETTAYAVTAINQAGSGSGTISWDSLNVSDATGSPDGSSATASLSAVGTFYTNWLKLTAYGFAIPSDATINGIEMSVTAKGTDTNLYAMRLVRNGSIELSGMTDNSDFGSSMETRTYGSSTELWGASWTPTDINSSGFGLALEARLVSPTGTPKTISIDAAQLKVYYTPAGGSNTVVYSNNASPADNATISSSGNDPTNSGRTGVYQTYRESDPFTNTVASIPSGQDGIWDFALTSTAAADGKTYCFKTVKSDGSPLDNYNQYPEITFGSTSLSLDQMTRGGGGVLNGVKSKLTW